MHKVVLILLSLSISSSMAPMARAEPPLIAQKTLTLSRTSEAIDEIRLIGDFPTDGESATAFLIKKSPGPELLVNAVIVSEGDEPIEKLVRSVHPAFHNHKMALDLGQGKGRPKVYMCNELHVDFILKAKHEKTEHEPGICAKAVVIWIPKGKSVSAFYNGKKITDECALDNAFCDPPEASDASPVSP